MRRVGKLAAVSGLLLLVLAGCRNPTVVEYEPYESPGAIYPADELVGQQWHYEDIEMPGAWGILRDAQLSGDFANTIVAVIDTGIHHDHPDLDSDDTGGHDNILFDGVADVAGYDFYSGSEAYPSGTCVNGPIECEDAYGGAGRDQNPTDPGDGENSWHGIHVSGTIAADTRETFASDSGVAGIGWNTLQVLPIRALGQQGGSTADIAAAIYYAAGIEQAPGDALPAERARVVNLSLGGYIGKDQALYGSIAAAVGRGVTVIAAAGNESGGQVMQPASYDNTIAVSATDATRQVASYSNVGPEIDLAAPGGGNPASDENGDGISDGILSTYYDDTSGPPYFRYAYISGTSMATPHVSGVVGLLYSYAPNLTQDAVYAILANTAKDLGEPGHDEQFGHGLIDAQAALEYLINAGRDFPVQPRTLGGGDARGGGISSAAVSSLAVEGAGRSRGRRPTQRRGAILPEAGAALDTTSIIIKLTERAEDRRGLAAARSLADGIGAEGAVPIGGRLYRVDLQGAGNVESAIRALGTHEDIEYAQPNYRYSLIE
ncbi:MAG: S8 family serine peptidase [Spirochaetes bacterium]|nr:S8 family serine peptidase [Spirochaetota bacterium]